MKFAKMHGCGNDFIIFNEMNNQSFISAEQIKRLCNRQYGIGADGVLIISPSDVADIKMRIINADGTEAEMCGNGIRCIARFAYDNDILKREKFKIETGAGIKQIELILHKDQNIIVKVDMGKAEFLNNPIKNEYDLYCVSVGNPHAVMIVDNFDNDIVKTLGPKIENNKAFIHKTNVDFVKIIDKKNIILRMWERGCGETEACGTGACASVSVLHHIGLLSNHCNVDMLGGSLTIDIINNEIFMTGEAVKVFDGEIEI